jgi:NSS family neurotransmitter:Na+ symporter
VSLVVFAMFETILFSWIFGMKKGWAEITSGADIQVPIIYKFIIKFITPVMLIIIFLGSLFKPLNNNWSGNVSSFFSGNGWVLDNGSIVKTIMHAGIKEQIRAATDPVVIGQLEERMMYINFARLLLLALFVFISTLVYFAFLKRRREGRATL